MGLAAAFVALAFLVWFLWSVRPAPDAPRALRAPGARGTVVLTDGRELVIELTPRAWTAAPAGRPHVLHEEAAPGGGTLLQLAAAPVNEAGVWDERGDIRFRPDGAVAMAFVRGGAEVLCVRHEVRRRGERPRRRGVEMVTTTQSEVSWFFGRWSWPGRNNLQEVALRFPTGWAHALRVSPDESQACLQWLDQSQSGWLLISLGERLTVGDAVVVERHTNLMCEPVFSPDGRFIAATAARDFDWWLPPPPAELRPSYSGAKAAQRHETRRRDDGRAHPGVPCSPDGRGSTTRSREPLSARSLRSSCRSAGAAIGSTRRRPCSRRRYSSRRIGCASTSRMERAGTSSSAREARLRRRAPTNSAESRAAR